VNTCLITENVQKRGSYERNRKRSHSLRLTVLACLGKNRSVQKAEIAILHTPVEEEPGSVCRWAQFLDAPSA
jgi:hypothetical protein